MRDAVTMATSRAVLWSLAVLLMMVTGTSAQETYFFCGFESGNVCDMVNIQGEPVINTAAGPFDWLVRSGRTDTGMGAGDPRTGPFGAAVDAFYMYLEGSDPRATRDYAMIETPPLAASGQACLSFYYNMNGAGVGLLEVYHLPSSTGQPSVIWRMQGDQGLDWIRETITLSLVQSGDKVGFRGERGSDFRSDISVDDIRIVAGICDDEAPLTENPFASSTAGPPRPVTSSGSTSGPQSPLTEPPPIDVPSSTQPTDNTVDLPYGCDFETEDICGMEQSTNDQFDWSRNSGGTPTSLTGPTGAYAGSFYMFIESSDPRAEGDYALLETPKLNYRGAVCVQFYYHMRGTDVGALYINTARRPLEFHWGRFLQNLGDQWNLGQVDVTLEEEDQIQFIGQRGPDIRGDIAIDTIAVREGICQATEQTTVTTTTTTAAPTPPPSTGLPFSCSFEFDICGMTQRQDDQYDWARRQGTTETGDTGPDGTSWGAVYLYAEGSSPRAPNDRAVLETPGFSFQGEICVHFRYHMYGQDMGQLLVSLSNRQTLFQRGGNQGNNWFSADVSAMIVQGDVIQFIAIRGSSYRSDLAIDDVRISLGGCSGGEVTPAPPTEAPPIPEDSFYFSCDIESDGSTNTFCRLRQDSGDHFDWTRTTGRTPSGAIYDRRFGEQKVPVTGPDGAQQGNYYAYIESSGKPFGLTAVLILEGSLFNVEGRNCLKFWYSMNGFHTGQLSVFISSGSGRVTKWRMTGDQLFGWKRASVELNLDGSPQIGIVAETKGEFSGDIAIDDVELSYSPCQAVPAPPGVPPAYLFLCNFETTDGGSTLCNMEQDSSQDSFDWTLWTRNTPSEVTGPTSAYNGAFYIYIEASTPRNRGDNAKILMPFLNYNGDVCVEFWYHLYGFHIDELELFTRLGGVDTQVWNLVGQQGNFWAQQRYTIEALRSDQRIGLKGVVGAAYSGDIALDNIQVRPGRC